MHYIMKLKVEDVFTGVFILYRWIYLLYGEVAYIVVITIVTIHKKFGLQLVLAFNAIIEFATTGMHLIAISALINA